jgi:dihydropteroate synthase
MLHGAAIFRVHNVRAAAQTIRIIQAVESAVR